MLILSLQDIIDFPLFPPFYFYLFHNIQLFNFNFNQLQYFITIRNFTFLLFYWQYQLQVHFYITPKQSFLLSLQYIEVMEKEGSMSTIPILPFLHQLKHRRRLYSPYAYFIFTIELFFLLMLPLSSSQSVADTPIATIIDVYQSIILLSPISVCVVNTLFFLVPLLVLLVVLTLYLQSHMQSADKYGKQFEQLRQIYIICLIGLESTILPGFLMAAHNIVNLVAPAVRTISFINLPFAVVLIALEKERRLYQAYFILIVMVRLFLPLSWTPLVITLISCWVAADEHAVHKRIGYYLLGVWCGLITLSTSLGVLLNSFQLLLALAATATLTLLCPNAVVNCDCLEQNESLMALSERMMDGRELSLKEKMAVSKAAFRFREELLAAEKYHLSEREAKWLSVECDLQGEQICQFLGTKIAFELRKEYSHELKMQQLQCEVRLGKLGMRTLLEMEALIQQVTAESTFRQKEKLHELVTLTDQLFLKKEQSADASTTIAHEKEIERLYQLFINIAILMQQFWTLHKGSRLSSQALSAVLRQVGTMEEEAQGILRKAGRFGSTRHELLIFEYLRKLVNNSHKVGEWREAEEGKEEGVAGEHRNYILIEQGSILGMSNRLLNEFQLTRREAEGYRLSDIVNEQTAEYLTARLDRLIEEDQGEQNNFILPLKVSRGRSYIQPYRAQVEILPDLMKGIKFILHLEKPTQLQKTPFLLYCGNSDSVVGITRNFASYFGLQQDHYLFHDFTHELFNVDILALVQTPAKEGSQIICEFKAKRMSTRGDGRSKITHVPVVLRKVKQYEVREETLVLLAIVKREQLERTQMANLMSEKIVFFQETHKEDSGHGEELEGKTFCKITNPYENLIDEKISKMEQFYRMSYLKGLLLIVGCFILLLLGTLAALPMRLSGVTSSLMQNYGNNVVLNDKAINTLELFTQSAILYQLGHYPQQFLAVNPAYDLTALTADYTQKVDSDIQTILEEDIENQIFTYSEQLREVSIYDILGSAKLAITTRNITSLIAVWPSISNVTGTALVASKYTLDTMADFFKMFSWLAMLIGGLLVVAAEVVSFKVEQVFQEILHLYEKIDTQHSQQFLLKYRVFAHQLYCSSYFRGVKANNYLLKYKNRKQLDSVEEISTLLYLEKEVGFQFQHENVPADSVPGEAKVSRKLCLSFLWRESYLLLLLLSFVGFLQLFLYFLVGFQSGFSLALEHSIHLHEARGNISYNSAYFMTSSLQETLPAQQQMPPTFPTKMVLTLELSSPLPPFFSAYAVNESQVANSDLCARSLNSNPLYVEMSCGKVMGGIMQRGFPEAVIFFNDLVNKYSFSRMSQLGTLFRPSATYPVFMEVLYLRRALYSLITSFETGFKQRTQEYISAETGTLNTIIRLGWLLLPLFLVILGVFYCGMREKCGTALKAFFILPKEYLLEMKVTKVLRQRDILNYIQRLAF